MNIASEHQQQLLLLQLLIRKLIGLDSSRLERQPIEAVAPAPTSAAAGAHTSGRQWTAQSLLIVRLANSRHKCGTCGPI